MKKPNGYWNYAGRVVRHLRYRGMKWREISEVWGTTEGLLHNAAHRYSAREFVKEPPHIRGQKRCSFPKQSAV